jgi:hypothetical protein
MDGQDMRRQCHHPLKGESHANHDDHPHVKAQFGSDVGVEELEPLSAKIEAENLTVDVGGKFAL